MRLRATRSRVGMIVIADATNYLSIRRTSFRNSSIAF